MLETIIYITLPMLGSSLMLTEEVHQPTPGQEDHTLIPVPSHSGYGLKHPLLLGSTGIVTP